MGAWGSGIYENDQALDFAADILEEMAARVEALLESPACVRNESQFVVLLRFLALLWEDSGSCVGIRPDRIESWRDGHHRAFEDYMLQVGTEELFAERRLIVERECARLLACARSE